MAALSTHNLTLADWAKRVDPDGRVPIIAELLSQSNEILDDAVFVEANQPTGHRVVIRTGLPVVYWRALNQGVPPSKSTTAQVDEAIGMLEAYSETDKDLAELNGNTAQFRLSEDRAFLEAMNQTQTRTLFYGEDSKQYLGLAPRYSTLSEAQNGQNIIDGGGNGERNTSIWLVVWGDNTVFCTFPKGSKAGLHHEDKGVHTLMLPDGSRFEAYRTHYQWKNGLVVKDWRYVVRIANIDVGKLIEGGKDAPDLVALLSRAQDRIPNWGMGRAAFYLNRTVYSMLRLQALNKSNYAVTIEKGLNQFGTPMSWTAFDGVPLRRVDQLHNTEARVQENSPAEPPHEKHPGKKRPPVDDNPGPPPEKPEEARA